ncbi:transposase [Virgibacillus phasianinus]|uniref:Transposase n=1 Tax=Virgibacillus phasianinus TaxID=2017483 RepID=A0A220U2W4_9BACI|nr:transposase [Virgibacillus phasianinus]ASK62427.1 transposase [Virgibacillus phasianinus]
MPRNPRKRSRNGIYHIMLRGINRQTIFEDDEDRFRILETIKRYKTVSKIEVYSYCLMDNHIHLLIRESEESVSKVIQRIGASYVYWYNAKYKRCGHLFQDRFKSESVETIPSFLRVLRYIHQNPVKAGLAANALECKWTSIKEYFGHASMVDVDFGLRLFTSDRSKAIQLFSDYMQLINDDDFMDDRIRVRLTDEEVRDHLSQLGFPNGSALQQMKPAERNAIILEMKGVNGVAIRQLSRITGISKSVIHRIR